MNSLERAISFSELKDTWKYERSRLIASCFGVDRVSGEAFALNLNRELREIRYRLSNAAKPRDASEKFKARGLLALVKPKDNGGNRIICVPTIADRLIQFSILNQLRPALKAYGLDNRISYGLARGKDRSVLGARIFACSARSNKQWAYKTDIRKFFDNLDRNILLESMHKIVRQRSLLPILEAYVDAEIEDGLDPNWKNDIREAGITKGRGVRQGMPLSPFFAGLYLRDVDKWLMKRNVLVARYVDDLIAFFETEREAFDFHSRLSERLQKIDLEIGPPNTEKSKTVIYSPSTPASFLGMQVSRNPNGGYRMMIAPEVVSEIIEKIKKAQSIDELLKRGVVLSKMGTYFSSVEKGYLAYYEGAQNRDDLRDRMRGASEQAQQSIMISLFGDQRLKEMTDAQLKFLGVAA